ncbi:toll/interleukin-1 receptor domain-containing protein [Flavobacterium taihuense]|uniref:SIR2 family protein n=1 Tax=Flavobacterium taihuense TaxID=2857508 RepID=A0ABS6XZD5_9FLAO|nr:SIR2 family protein [Flavobacterium taihuense]MBW4362053.1 SIR2 family protein [Flavobacterium taihuense]
MTTEIENAYTTIARQITSPVGQCVLILGPELVINKDGIGYKNYFRDILPKKSKYFDSENLFYFYDQSDCFTVKDKVIKYYEEVGDPALIEMISRIPFPLIINVNPDKAINKIYKNKGIPFAEGHFTKDSKTEFNSLIPIPSKEIPVIYNIFGTIDVEQSLILTHKKLYQTIEFLLPKKSLPDNIELFLNETANSFIFLGFKFDSWQYQLLCHKLIIKSQEDVKTNISSIDIIENENVSIIMNNSFDMKFTSQNPMQCIQNIIRNIESIQKDKNIQYLRPKNPNGAYSTFISYARKDDSNIERENIVNYIEKQFNTNNQNNIYQLFRDRNDLKYGDSIDSFMTHIGVGKTVIRVISHKYLTSIFCMIEAYRMQTYMDNDKRIYTIVMDDADIHSKDSIKKYKDYWFNECQTILNDPTKLGNGNYDDYVKIYRFIDTFIAEIKDQVHLQLAYTDVNKKNDLIAPSEYTINDTKKPEFEQFLSNVFSKMQEQ